MSLLKTLTCFLMTSGSSGAEKRQKELRSALASMIPPGSKYTYVHPVSQRRRKNFFHDPQPTNNASSNKDFPKRVGVLAIFECISRRVEFGRDGVKVILVDR